MTNRKRFERATASAPLGSAVLVKSRLDRYLASFLEATGLNRLRHFPNAAAPVRVPALEAAFRSAFVKRRFHGVEQSAYTERHVVDHTVHEEPGRATHAALEPALDVLANALGIHPVIHLGGVQRHVEP